MVGSTKARRIECTLTLPSKADLCVFAASSRIVAQRLFRPAQHRLFEGQHDESN
jgi:hypothetical protein